ncbi:hypothetical protein B0O99DRAFT_636570 [Bisporella sp. PMI_857]|nr:hypothetical protein B0O99DRAFT_636570 [Bisporella sp. PMI_857]
MHLNHWVTLLAICISTAITIIYLNSSLCGFNITPRVDASPRVVICYFLGGSAVIIAAEE